MSISFASQQNSDTFFYFRNVSMPDNNYKAVSMKWFAMRLCNISSKSVIWWWLSLTQTEKNIWKNADDVLFCYACNWHQFHISNDFILHCDVWLYIGCLRRVRSPWLNYLPKFCVYILLFNDCFQWMEHNLLTWITAVCYSNNFLFIFI